MPLLLYNRTVNLDQTSSIAAVCPFVCLDFQNYATDFNAGLLNG